MGSFPPLINLALACPLAFPAFVQDPEFVTPTPAEWREDIAHLWSQLDRVHVDPFHHVSPEKLKEAFDALAARADEAARHEMIVGIAQLVATLGPADGHSELWIAPTNDQVGFHHLPIGVYRFADGFRVQTAREDYAELLGAKVLRIGGASVEAAFDRVATATSTDNDSHANAYATLLMTVPEILHAVGVTESPLVADFVLEGDGGARITETLPIIDPQSHLYQWQIEPTLPDSRWRVARLSDRPTPLYLRAPGVPFWMEFEEETGILYVQINVLRDGPDETMASFYDRVFVRAEEADAEALVLDVRQSGGGSNLLNRPLIHHLIRSERFRDRGRLFLIIGRHTFSAASHLVTYIESETDAILVGEPTGGSPNHFGDVGPVPLPNSGLQVVLSRFYWQNSLPWDRRPSTPPDVSTPLTFENYRAGRDPAMIAIRARLERER